MSRRSAWLVLSGLLGSLLIVVAGPAPAAGADEIVVPTNGSFPMEGHGWGHGHGLSQYGAQGAATLSKTADQITAFYYPHTTKTQLPSTTMRIALLADDGHDLQVYPATGLTVTDTATGAHATLPTGPTRWRVTIDSAGEHIASLSGSTWTPYALGGKTAFTGPVRFSASLVRVLFPDGTSRDYRTSVQAAKRTSTSLYSVAVMSMESYLYGVVPRESSSSWEAAALQAQAIAARSYAAWKRANAPSTQPYDICDTTMCQVFGGTNLYSSGGTKTPLEASSTNSAVQATAGVIRSYGGKPIFAEFSASNGGWSTDGGLPYLIAQRDDWDGVTGSSVHYWKATLTTAQLQAAFPAVGTLKRMRITARDGNGDWGGRVQTVVLEGVDGSGQATSVTTTGAGVYHAHPWPGATDGLRSSWWHVIPAYGAAVITRTAAPRLVRSPGVSTGTMTATVKNTGTSSWSTSGLSMVVASPVGAADPLVGGSTRPGVYNGSATSIAPGQTATFTFSLTGDGVSPGFYQRSYKVRVGTGQVFGASAAFNVYVDAPVFTGTPVGGPTGTKTSSDPNAPGPVLADGRSVVVPVAGSTPVQLTVRNTGNLSWPAGSDSLVRLGTSGPRDRDSASAGASWLTAHRASALSGSSPVAPGGNGAFGLTLYGNGRPLGITSESFEPVWEGQHWIDGGLTALNVVRVDPAVSRQATVDTAPPAKLSISNAPNGTAELVVRMRNVGGSSWPVGSEVLGASQSPLRTSAWSSSTRPPALARNVTRPSVAAVYPGEVGEWRVPLSGYRHTPGSYPLALQLFGPDGKPYGPRQSLSITVTAASFTGSLVGTSSGVRVPRNGTASAWFDVKNTGNIAWPVGGPIRSAVVSSSGSPSHASSWINAMRPGTLTANRSRPGATTVRPGETARFVVVLAGNGRAPQTTSELFQAGWETWSLLPGSRARLAYSVV